MSNIAKTPNRNAILVRALIILFMGGLVNTPAVFVAPLAEHYGWTTEAVAGVATYMAFMCTPGHFLSGWMLGRVGAKKTLMIGCVVMGLAFLLSGLVPEESPWMLYITFSVLQGIGVGFLYTGGIYSATGWYPDTRGLVSGLALACNGGAATFLAPLIARLIVVLGVKVTLFIVGAAVIVIGLTAAAGLQSVPEGYIPEGWKADEEDEKFKATQLESLTPSQVIKTRGYWHLFFGFGFFPVMYIICYPRFSVLVSQAGFSLTAATLGVSIYSIANVASRFLFGALIDKIGYRKVYTLCGACCIASSLVLMFAGNNLVFFYTAYILLAFGFGPTNSCHPVAIQETFGPKYAGGVFGVCMLGYMLIATGIAPKISVALVSATGNYTASMIFAIISCIIAVAVYTTIPMPKRRKLSEIEAEKTQA